MADETFVNYYKIKTKDGPIRLGTCNTCGAVTTPGSRALHDAWHKGLVEDLRRLAEAAGSWRRHG